MGVYFFFFFYKRNFDHAYFLSRRLFKRERERERAPSVANGIKGWVGISDYLLDGMGWDDV